MLYSIKLTQEQLSYVGNVLGRCPYVEVKDLIASMQEQIVEIEKPPPETGLSSDAP